MKIVIVSVLLAVGLVACGSDEPDAGSVTSTTLNEVSESVDIRGTALVELPAGPDPATGLVAPEVTAAGFTGKQVSIEHDGTAKVIIFLAHWCSHCQNEVKELAPFFSELEVPEGVELYSVATSTTATRPNYPPSDWLLEAGWQLPVLIDTADSEIAQSYGLSAFPFWVVLDGDGVVLTRTAGGLGVTAVQALLANLASF